MHLFETSTGLLSDFESYLKVAASIGVGGGLRVITSLPDNADDGILVASSRDISLDNHILALSVGDLETIVGGFLEKVKALEVVPEAALVRELFRDCHRDIGIVILTVLRMLLQFLNVQVENPRVKDVLSTISHYCNKLLLMYAGVLINLKSLDQG